MAPDELPDHVESGRRRVALGVLGFMLLVFIVLSGFSFVSSRNQITPDTVTYAETFGAVDGKRVFQAYNCMGCHTIVGNGAYLGPDLTNTYESAGPAWMAAFLPSAGSWPTEAALRVQLQNPDQVAETGITDLAAYYEAYPGAKERIERRAGLSSFMPNLSFRSDEVPNLLAFFKYTSLMDTEGWPPKPKVDGLANPLAAKTITTVSTTTTATTAAASSAPAGAGAAAAAGAAAEPTATAIDGKEVANRTGCFACHATDAARLVGPGWGGIYDTTTELEGGGTATVDGAYLAESITAPDAKVVAGYPAGVMPSYENILSSDEISAIVAYIRSLEKP